MESEYKQGSYKDWAKNYQQEIDQNRDTGDHKSAWLSNPLKTLTNAFRSEMSDWTDVVPANLHSSTSDQRDMYLDAMKAMALKQHANPKYKKNANERAVSRGWENIKTSGKVEQLPASLWQELLPSER